MEERKLSAEDVKKLNSKLGLLSLLSKEPLNLERGIRNVDYQKKLVKLIPLTVLGY
jgi:hypothetical protein